MFVSALPLLIKNRRFFHGFFLLLMLFHLEMMVMPEKNQNIFVFLLI